MNPNTRPHFDIVTDLRRCVICIKSGNTVGAEEFLHNANIIMNNQLQSDQLDNAFHFPLKSTWETLYNTKQQMYSENKLRFAEQLLLISSIIFLRTLYSNTHALN